MLVNVNVRLLVNVSNQIRIEDMHQYYQGCVLLIT